MAAFWRLRALFGREHATQMPPTDLRRRFDVGREIHDGPLSSVYAARDTENDNVVCLKVLKKKTASELQERYSKNGLQRPAEGTVCSSLQHPNVVSTYAHGVSSKGEPFVVMELIEGETLDRLIRTRSSTLCDRRSEILVQLAEALRYLHRSYLHRDICPRNIMLDSQGVVKLIDFGLTIPYLPQFCAKVFLVGTPDYLAPEVIQKKPFDHRADLFSLGVSAYELYTGHLPWRKMDPSHRDCDRFHLASDRLNRDGADPRTFRIDLDEGIVKFLNRAIQRNPDQRFQTAAELGRAARHLAS